MNTDALVIQFGYTHYVISKNIEGLTQEESLFQPQPGGNCMNWVLGHILAARNGMLGILGEEQYWTDEDTALYKRNSGPLTDAARAKSLEEMTGHLASSQERVLAGLKKLEPARLSEPAPFSPAKNPDETVGSLLAGLTFHEAYHAGQTGILRRLIGKTGALA